MVGHYFVTQILFLEDINDLFSSENKYAVMCVQHDYNPDEKKNWVQAITLSKKNWSSLVLWNCSHQVINVNPELVNTQTGKYLHRFGWLKDEEIGKINHEWNWLVGGIKNQMMENLKVYIYRRRAMVR